MLSEEDEQLRPPNDAFACQACNQLANDPVVTPCGHLHCWKCIHLSNHCSACSTTFHPEELFSVFVSRDQLAAATLPDKPKPIYRDKIRNTSALQVNLPRNLTLQSNFEAETLLSGYALFPSTVTNVFSSLEDSPMPEEKQVISYAKIIKLILLILLLSLIILH